MIIVDLRKEYPDSLNPLINLLNRVKKESVNPHEYGSSYIYIISEDEIWILTKNPVYVSGMYVGIVNPNTFEMEITFKDSTDLTNARYDGTVDKIFINYPNSISLTKLITIVTANAQAIKDARALIGL